MIKLGKPLQSLKAALGRKPRPRLSHSDSSSPLRGAKQAASSAPFNPRKH